MMVVPVRLLRIEFVLEPPRIKTCMCGDLQFIANFILFVMFLAHPERCPHGVTQEIIQIAQEIRWCCLT